MKCLIEKKCGSCKYINTDYQKQLNIKMNYCKKLLNDQKCIKWKIRLGWNILMGIVIK